MLKTMLQFASVEELRKFKLRMQSCRLTILEKSNVLIAELFEKEIQLACTYYSATIIRKHAIVPVL